MVYRFLTIVSSLLRGHQPHSLGFINKIKIVKFSVKFSIDFSWSFVQYFDQFLDVFSMFFGSSWCTQ